ncbi:acyltransferase family protein [Janibacter hoylei]|nr:acyltransferase family protein [Janibacter hoylei]
MDTTTISRLAAATPDTRNRVVDLYRAVAIGVVVLGHWLMAAVVVRDGELAMANTLDLVPPLQGLTWVLQVMPLFFLVGGYANATSWRSARA